VKPGQKSEGLGSHQQGDPDVHTQEKLEATFTERQPPEVQLVLERKAGRYG